METLVWLASCNITLPVVLVTSAVTSYSIPSHLNQLAAPFNIDVVEAHCYVVDIGQTDREQIRSRINNN